MTTVTSPTRHAMPFTRIELAVMGLIDGRLQILLARRSEAPHAGKWALPGGVLRIDLDGSLEDATRRVMRERLGLEAPALRQLAAVGGPTRDPRAPWSLSIVYRALVRPEHFVASPGKRIETLGWRSVNEADSRAVLAFDHGALVEHAASVTQREVEDLGFPFELLPAEFTLAELQGACEQVLGRRLDKSSFRRRLADRALVVPVDGAFRGGANRPAQLYRPSPLR